MYDQWHYTYLFSPSLTARLCQRCHKFANFSTFMSIHDFNTQVKEHQKNKQHLVVLLVQQQHSFLSSQDYANLQG